MSAPTAVHEMLAGGRLDGHIQTALCGASSCFPCLNSGTVYSLVARSLLFRTSRLSTLFPSSSCSATFRSGKSLGMILQTVSVSKALLLCGP